MNSQSSNQHAAAELIRLLRERRGLLTDADRQYIIDLYMRSTNMDRARVEQWLAYTLERTPIAPAETRSVPITEMPLIQVPTVKAPNPNDLVGALASRLPARTPAPVPLRPEDVVPPKL